MPRPGCSPSCTRLTHSALDGSVRCLRPDWPLPTRSLPCRRALPGPSLPLEVDLVQLLLERRAGGQGGVEVRLAQAVEVQLLVGHHGGGAAPFLRQQGDLAEEVALAEDLLLA